MLISFRMALSLLSVLVCVALGSWSPLVHFCFHPRKNPPRIGNHNPLPEMAYFWGLASNDIFQITLLPRQNK